MLVLGSRNAGKAREMRPLLAPYRLQLRTLADFPEAIDVEETGGTFAENARLKAVQQARHLNQWVIGEDSGLVVDALDGAPGVRSARFAGQGASDEQNNRYLLEQLGDTPLQRRSARYVCHITLADPTGAVRADCEACCRGRIRFEEAGQAGFGYDPLFEIPEYHRTFGQLGETVKSVLSHRARALRMLLRQILALR